MRRLALSALLSLLLALAVSGADATLIDNFETGSYSVSRSTPGSTTATQTPDASHCVAPQREVLLTYYATNTGPLSSELVPLQNVDDGVVHTYPIGNGADISMIYQGGPWDLTEGGTLNRIVVRATGGGPETALFVTLYDLDGINDYESANFSSTGNYIFALSNYNVDPTRIVQIRVTVFGRSGETLGLKNIESSSGSTVTLLYQAWAPRVFTWQCGPNRGGPSIGWDWAVGWPAEPTLAGPELQITGVSGAGCAGVEFEAQDSGAGGFGEVGLVTVDWQAQTFDNGLFELRFVTDPNAGYVAQPVGDPVVDTFGTGFRISHDVHVTDVFGIPDGLVRQELIVAPAPGQEIYLDYVEALPLGGGSEVGYSLSFGYTGAVFDPSQPLLEIYTNASFGDDAGATGVALPVAQSETRILTARPTVTRSETRFVLARPRQGPETVEVFDVSGRLVRRLEARSGEAVWNGTNASGSRVPAGVYFGRVPGMPRAARVILVR